MIEKYSEERPWGNFVQFCKNQQCTVKIISVNPDSELSLQYHNNRDEFWKILSGKASIVIGETVHASKEGDEFFIPMKVLHQIITNEDPVKVMEISFGVFDEDDIVRIKDKYDRIQ